MILVCDLISLKQKTELMRYFTSLLLVLSLFMVSCEGPQGIPGPPGPPGADGGIFAASAFEIVLNFNAGNNYEFIEPYGFEVLESDVTLVYLLWENFDGTDIWRLCPQNVFFPEGILTYNYDFTQTDVRFFLDGTIDFNILNPDFTQNQVFRVVVVPADNVDGVDVSNINNVLNLEQVRTLEVR
jgi:hypothetical protein